MTDLEALLHPHCLTCGEEGVYGGTCPDCKQHVHGEHYWTDCIGWQLQQAAIKEILQPGAKEKRP